MKTKIVYVLASNERDYYLEQTLMSVYSLRLHNPDAKVTLVTDTDTYCTCKEGVRKDFLGYFDEVMALDTPEYSTNVEKSRHMKTSIRNIIDGDFLYIDGDTIVCESLEEIDLQDSPLAMVADIHIGKKEDYDLWYSQKMMKENFGNADLEKYYNSGVAYVKDTEEMRLFYKRWHEEWKKTFESTGAVVDQPPLHAVIKKYAVEVKTLDGVWNCQICGNFMPYFYKAKILHTFTSPYFDSPCIFRDKEICEEIRANGALTEHIISLIHSPKEAFHPIHILLGREGPITIRHKFFYRSAYFRKNHPTMLSILGFTSKMLMGVCVVLNKVRRKK